MVYINDCEDETPVYDEAKNTFCFKHILNLKNIATEIKQFYTLYEDFLQMLPHDTIIAHALVVFHFTDLQNPSLASTFSIIRTDNDL